MDSLPADLPMLKQADVSFASENAMECVKNTCSVVVPAVDKFKMEIAFNLAKQHIVLYNIK